MSNTNQHYGAKCIAEHYHVQPSPLGVKVADLLYYLYDGLYHLSQASLKRVDWTNVQWMEISVPSGLPTCGNRQLTRLVFLAHHLCVRVEIMASGPRMLKLGFHERSRSTLSYSGHPTLDQAVEDFKEDFDFLEIPAAEEATVKP